MINNRDNEDNDNTIKNIFIGLFSVLLFVEIVLLKNVKKHLENVVYVNFIIF